MTEEETFVSAKMMLVSAIVATCLSFIFALYALSGAYGYERVFVTTWHFVSSLAVSAFLWLEVAKKKKKTNKQWTRYIEAALFVVVCVSAGLLIASYLLLPYN
ncbi:MAG: hypothetical protein ACE5H4_00865 [Candidatus Thorarchaeota archaeon]